MLDNLKHKHYDLLVIGGGATGTGVALDAATRGSNFLIFINLFLGLSVALIEREDFGSGTSSRSTKLVHGGVRYLENAVKNLDPEQLWLVREVFLVSFLFQISNINSL